MMINNKMETKTVVKLRKIAKKSRMSTKCQENLQLYKGNYPLFTNLLFVFVFVFFVFAFCFWDRFLFFEKLNMCFFLKENCTDTKNKRNNFSHAW